MVDNDVVIGKSDINGDVLVTIKIYNGGEVYARTTSDYILSRLGVKDKLSEHYKNKRNEKMVQELIDFCNRWSDEIW